MGNSLFHYTCQDGMIDAHDLDSQVNTFLHTLHDSTRRECDDCNRSHVSRRCASSRRVQSELSSSLPSKLSKDDQHRASERPTACRDTSSDGKGESDWSTVASPTTSRDDEDDWSPPSMSVNLYQPEPLRRSTAV